MTAATTARSAALHPGHPGRARALAEGPYRVAPGTKLRHVQGELWAVETAGTRRQQEFFPLQPLLLRAPALSGVLGPWTDAEPSAGAVVTADGHDERALAALVREQALVRAPRDVVAPEDELKASVASGRCGVVLIAMGKPNYGRLAAALATTIKAASPAVPVALAWSGDVLTGVAGARGLFDHLIPIDAMLAGKHECREPFYVKLCIDQITPFERTLFIDADSLIYPGVDLRKEFWRYAGHDFVPTTSLVWQVDSLPPGAAYMCWGELAPIVRYFGLRQPMLQAHSYYFYFEHTARAKAVFECGREVHRVLSKDTERFGAYRDEEGRGVPDELAIGIATSMVGVEPYFESHQPMVESGLFYEDPPRGLEHCYLGFTVTGYNPNWEQHYLSTLEGHGSSHLGYKLEKDPPEWLRQLQRGDA